MLISIIFSFYIFREEFNWIYYFHISYIYWTTKLFITITTYEFNGKFRTLNSNIAYDWWTLTSHKKCRKKLLIPLHKEILFNKEIKYIILDFVKKNHLLIIKLISSLKIVKKSIQLDIKYLMRLMTNSTN